MDSKLWKLLGVVSGALALVFGLVPRSYRGVSCGGVFWESRDAFKADLVNALNADAGMAHGAMDHAQHCVDVRGGFLPWVLVFGVLAVGFFVAARMMGKDSKSPVKSDASGEWAKRLDEPEDSL